MVSRRKANRAILSILDTRAETGIVTKERTAALRIFQNTPQKAKPLAITYTKQRVILANWYHPWRSHTLLLPLLKPGPFSVGSEQAEDSAGVREAGTPGCRVPPLYLSFGALKASPRLVLFTFLSLNFCSSTSLNAFLRPEVLADTGVSMICWNTPCTAVTYSLG